ncbi:MAG: DUF6106 family protein [Clostridia bacterium]|nr:DUF6106 family protein [Clostridia bacterium]
MDIFIEKIVARKKDIKDTLFNIGIVLAVLIISFILMMIPFVQNFILFLFAGMVFGAYYLITSRNIEYEYIVTNSDIDIDRIIARRKRKRVFSGNCKEFDIVAKVSSDKYSNEVKSIRKRMELASSIDSPDVYFLTTSYKGEKTVVFFEPDKRMLNAFKAYIPRKVFE